MPSNSLTTYLLRVGFLKSNLFLFCNGDDVLFLRDLARVLKKVVTNSWKRDDYILFTTEYIKVYGCSVQIIGNMESHLNQLGCRSVLCFGLIAQAAFSSTKTVAA